MPPDLPDISRLDAEQLLVLHDAIEIRLDEVRAAFIDKARRLGLSITNGTGKRRRRRARKDNEMDARDMKRMTDAHPAANGTG